MTKGFLGRELPFKCIVGDEPEVCENIFSGEKVGLPADAVAVYDVIMKRPVIQRCEKSYMKKSARVVTGL